MFESIVNLINQDLGQPTAVRAIAVGMSLSVGITQYLKFRPAFKNLTAIQYRLLVRGIALFSTFIFTWMLWPPDDVMVGAVMGLATGAVTPALYNMIMHPLYRHSPRVEVIVSGRPGGNTTTTVTTDDCAKETPP